MNEDGTTSTTSFWYDEGIRNNAILYINTLISYVNKEQLPSAFGSDYDFSKEEIIDELRQWAKEKIEEVNLDGTNWALTADEDTSTTKELSKL